ncbi:hypothetical protein [Lyngbya confervoides]|uniref:Uncharacterized protein n=1 Tax=Lyngbya confervoides BDU141951 TaxID=1574623 RepID=A0ABD4T6V7_9CYAN|nr:hypothetical protein [Lyngbya confervoides]MCM1984467.1 hypothetical protein [Lyngbya confervoides BDU141951]
MKKLVSGISLLAMSLTSTLGYTNPSYAEEISCQSTLGAITVDNVKVPPGKTCILNGTKVKGNIVVGNNATLRANAIQVNGNIQAEGATYVEVISNSRVGGSIQLKQGQRARLVGNRVTGSIQLESNRGTLVSNSNMVGSDLQAFQNTGGVTLRSNRIDGNLQCKENRPAPVGGGNIVQGSKEDQCRRL